MTSVYLYGALGRKFGWRWSLDVHSPKDAIRAIVANRPDFQKYLIAHSTPGYQIFIGPDPLAAVDELHYPNGRQAIKIVPVIAGAAKSPMIGILIGVVIIAAAIAFSPVGSVALAATIGSISASTALAIGGIGLVLAIGGITQALTSKPKAPDVVASETQEHRPSNIFNGPVNTIAQGHPVPIGFGRLRIGSHVISAGIRTEDIPV